MRILFITTKNPTKQGDLMEISILHGLRSLLGSNCVDYPRKKIMYGDFSESPKQSLHGMGFNLLSTPIQDLTEEERRLTDNDGKLKHFDFVLFGSGHMYGENPKEFDIYLPAKRIWYLDGHDLYGNAPRMIQYNEETVIGAQYMRCFKRELVENDLYQTYPSGFGIPRSRIKPLSFTNKTQLFPKTVPNDALFQNVQDMGGGRNHYKFTNEDEYMDDISKSLFGLTCKKGGWDCLRHYEILAAGTLLLFKDYDKKHELCSPQNLPCLSYSSMEDLNKVIDSLIIDGKPNALYNQLLIKQREWLLMHGTTEARALEIIKTLSKYL